MIPIVTRVLGTVKKGLLKGLAELGIRGRVETIQTKVLVRSVRILRRVPETCCHSDSSEKLSVDTSLKNSQKNEIIIIIKVRLGGKGDQMGIIQHIKIWPCN